MDEDALSVMLLNDVEPAAALAGSMIDDNPTTKPTGRSSAFWWAVLFGIAVGAAVYFGA